MKKKLWLLALVGAVLLSGGPVLADDGFYVVVMGRGVGTAITSLPKTITEPGFYYLTGNLTSDSYYGIVIDSDNVTLDLMGYCLKGNNTGTGIGMLNSRKNIEIRNGILSGLDIGILSAGGYNHRIINVRGEVNKNFIMLESNNNLIKGCSASGNNNGFGIYAFSGTISGNVVSKFSIGISCPGAGCIIGNNVTIDEGVGISISTSDPVIMDQNMVTGAGTHYGGGNPSTVWAGKNTDNPWGNNAGHQ